MNPGDFCDFDSLREAFGPDLMARVEQNMRDKYAAQLALYAAEAGRIKAASDRIEWAANKNLDGMRPAFHMHPLLWAQLNEDEAGWQDDPSFVKDLHRHQPETKVAMKTGGATNRVGWVPSLNRGGEKRYEGQKGGELPTSNVQRPTSNGKTLVITDKRGNAA